MLPFPSWCGRLYLTATALLLAVVICHLSPKTVSRDLLPVRLQTKAVLNSDTGATHFSAMGEAVAHLAGMVEYQHSAQATTLDVLDSLFLHQNLKAAILRLFPFLRSRFQTALADVAHYHRHTRGLVIPCGRADFHFALHLVAAVRHVFKSTLPIEVMYAGDEDLSKAQQEALEAVGSNITAVDLLHFYTESYVGLQGGGWAIKPFALLASSFEQVIIADSDVVFLQTPEAALDHPGYKDTGTLFFHDRIVGGDNAVHDWWKGIMSDKEPSQMMQKSRFWAGHTVHEMESGVVVFDKGRRSVLLGLLFVAWMNTKNVREQVTYQFTYGRANCALIILLCMHGTAYGVVVLCCAVLRCAVLCCNVCKVHLHQTSCACCERAACINLCTQLCVT